jgi:hypothetical protein
MKKEDGTMDFSEALRIMKDGASVTRLGWNGNGMFVLMQFPDENSKMTRPYIYIVCPRGSTKQFGETTKDHECVPWLASQTDLLAEDWMEIA